MTLSHSMFEETKTHLIVRSNSEVKPQSYRVNHAAQQNHRLVSFFNLNSKHKEQVWLTKPLNEFPNHTYAHTHTYDVFLSLPYSLAQVKHDIIHSIHTLNTKRVFI